MNQPKHKPQKTSHWLLQQFYLYVTEMYRTNAAYAIKKIRTLEGGGFFVVNFFVLRYPLLRNPRGKKSVAQLQKNMRGG